MRVIGLTELDNVERLGASAVCRYVTYKATKIAWFDPHASIRILGHRDNPIPPGRSTKRFLGGPCCGNPHRDSRLLNRRLKASALNVIVGPVVLHGLAAPQPGQHLQAFVKLGRARPPVAVITERSVFRKGGESRANSQDNSSV